MLPAGTLSDPNLWLDAAAQNAFDTGAGTGTLVSYGAYMNPTDGVVQLSAFVPIGNNFIRFICCLLFRICCYIYIYMGIL